MLGGRQRERFDDGAEVIGQRRRVGQVDAELERPAQLDVVECAVEQRLCERLACGDVDADGEVAGDVLLGLRRVHPAARQVERVALTQDDVERGLALGRGEDVVPVPRPVLRAQRDVEDRLVHDPALLARELQDEHVVDVVVRCEAL